jgi:tripartite-type tricarboxylate transporter receptor subunit TctC
VLYANTVGFNIVHVPYKSTAQSVTDLMAGRVNMQFATIPPTLPLIRSHQMQALATTGTKRNAALPDLPTMAETGLPGYDAVLWMAIETPAAVPPPIVVALNRALTKVLTEAQVRAALLAQGVGAEPGTPEALRARITDDIERWRAVIAKAGLKPS